MASQHLMPLPLFQTIPPGIHLLPPQPPKGAEVPTLLETTPNTGSVQIDKQFVESFLSGEACLSGGVRVGVCAEGLYLTLLSLLGEQLVATPGVFRPECQAVAQGKRSRARWCACDWGVGV